MKDYYKILGIASHASQDEIKRAYRKLAKKYHPDMHQGDDQLEQKFKDITEAYDQLKDEANRKKYDEKLNIKTAHEHKERSTKRQKTPSVEEFDMEQIHEHFERFFGFDPKTKEIKKRMSKKENPIDTSDMFNNFFNIGK